MMKKIISFISLSFLVVFLLVSCEKTSSDWVKYRTEKNGNVWSYKIINVEKKDGNHLVKVWDKTVYSDKGREEEIQHRTEQGFSNERYDKLSETQVLSEVDCKKQRERVLYIIDRGMDRKVLHSLNLNDNDSYWRYITPDTMGDNLHKEVCK